MNSFNPLDHQFQSKLGNMSVQPRADMWTKIQDQLTEEKEEKVAFWLTRPLWMGVGLVAFGGLVALGYWMKQDHKSEFSTPAQTKVVQQGTFASTEPALRTMPKEQVAASVSGNYAPELEVNLGTTSSGKSEAPAKAFAQKTYASPVVNTRPTIAAATAILAGTNETNQLQQSESLRTATETPVQVVEPAVIQSLVESPSSLTERANYINLLPALFATAESQTHKPFELVLPKKANIKKFRAGRDGLCYGDDSPDHHFATELYFNVGGTLKHLSSKIGQEEAYIQKRKDSETSLMNLGFGGRISYVFKRDFVFKAGIDYYQLNEKFVNKNSSTRIIILIDTIQTDMGPKVVTSTYQENGFTVNRYQNKYKMIDLPFSVGYQFRQKNYLLQVNGGASVNLTFIQEGKIVNNLGTPVSIDRFDPDNSNIFKTNLGVSLFGSVQLQVPLSKSNYFFVEPTVRYTLNDVTRPNYSLRQKLTMIGSQVGIGFKL